MTSERHSYHPAILSMVIGRVAMQAHSRGERVAVCGEMAARPDVT